MEEEILKRIDSLAESLGTTAEYMWSTLLRDVAIQGWVMVGVGVLLTVVGVLAVKAGLLVADRERARADEESARRRKASDDQREQARKEHAASNNTLPFELSHYDPQRYPFFRSKDEAEVNEIVASVFVVAGLIFLVTGIVIVALNLQNALAPSVRALEILRG